MVVATAADVDGSDPPGHLLTTLVEAARLAAVCSWQGSDVESRQGSDQGRTGVRLGSDCGLNVRAALALGAV